MTSNYAYFYDTSRQTYIAVSMEKGKLQATYLTGDRSLSSASLDSFDGLSPASADDAAGLHIYLKQIHKERLTVVDGSVFLPA